MTDKDKDHEKNILKENVQSAASLLCEIPFKKGPNSFEQDLKDPIPDQKSPWIAIHGTKSAIIANNRTQVEIVDVSDPEETRNKDPKMIQMTPKVLAIAFSACKEYVAIADAAGILSLYKSNGTLLFGHPVVRTDGSDSVVCIKFATSEEEVSSNDSQDLVVLTSCGTLLRLGNLKLAEFEQKLFQNTKDISSGVLKNIRFERANVGRLRENTLSCMLVHRFQSEQYVIIGNHAALMSVWKTVVGNEKDRPGIEKLSMCDSRLAPVDAMSFDGNYSLLVLLSKGKLSWWNWRDMTELFEADVIGVLSFAVLRACIGKEDEQNTSLLAVARVLEDGRSSNPLLQLIRIKHPEPGGSGNTCVVSTSESSKYLGTQSVCTNVALFASAGDTKRSQAIAACRTQRGVTMILLTNDVAATTNEADEIFASRNEDIVSVAKSLVDIPISSLLHKRSIEKYRTMLHACTNSIGNSDDESRAVLKHLLGVAARLREFTNSSLMSSSLSASLLGWCDEISELSYKWTTFQLLRSSTATEADGSGDTLRRRWHLFRTKPVLDTLKKFIKLGSMRAVKILWGRHLDGDVLRNIGKLMQLLPASLPVATYASWIQSEVIPSLIHHVEQSQSSEMNESDNRHVLKELARWLLERSEAAAAKSDLDTAIRICHLLKKEDETDSMKSRDYSLYQFQLHASSSNSLDSSGLDAKEPDVFECIEQLSHKLRHIKHLAMEHHFIISVSAFEDESPATIAMSMLDRAIDPESLKKEFRNHVKKYLLFCDVNIDSVLRNYVTELAETLQTSQSAEEARALVLLDEISDVNVRVDATLVLLRSVLPPYSQALKRYANNCVGSQKTERLEQIEEHVRLMEIQDMLSTYGIKQFDLADAKSASRLVAHILNQVSRSTALTDAMLLVDAYSDLLCDRAAVQFTENLLSDFDTVPAEHGLLSEVSVRVAKAMQALGEVKKRKEPKSNSALYVSMMEEIVAFGVMLLEMEARDVDDAQQNGFDYILQDGQKSQSFILWMLKSLVAAYLSELEAMADIVGTAPNKAYIENPEYLLSHALLVDLQRICQVEADFGFLLAVSVLRDPEKCEVKLKQLIKPEIMFGGGHDDAESTCSISNISFTSLDYVRKGKGKKRAVVSSGQSSPVAAKRQRAHESGCSQPPDKACPKLQQDDERTRLIFDLNRFALTVGIGSRTCNSLIAQSAAQNGFVLQAARLSREFFSRRSNAHIDPCNSAASISEQTDNLVPAEALKKVAISLSFYTSRNAKDIYDIPVARNHQLSPARVAQVQAPMYTMRLLKYALCMCDKEFFDETLLLLKNSMLVNEVLRFTQHSILSSKSSAPLWTLYPRWYRGDACALPGYEAMKLASKFAIAEHKNLRREVKARDTIASKRYISFLVEQRADLLSLQVLLSMHELPEDAASVVNTQMEKLLSTVFHLQEIDNYFALGLMLSMRHEDAFHAFRRQISRENVVKDYNRFQQLACIGADAARAWQQIAFLHQCVELEGNARWWHYLKLLGIECNYKAFQGKSRDLQYIRRLVPKLITRSNFDFYTVLEFTRHYQIADSFPSLAYAEALMLKESAGSNLEYQDKIASVLDDIHEKHLVKLLLQSIPKVSGQDYDRLLFIFRLLLENTSYPEREEVERRVAVLRNLKTFAAFQTQRDLDNNKMSDQLSNEEASASITTIQDGKVDANVISFHDLIAEPRVVLARLVSEGNVNALIGLAESLGLEPDELQMLLLKNMITANMQRNSSEDRNIDTSIAHFSAFEGILRCLSDAESRVTAAEWLAESIPLGKETLKALEFALNAAVSGREGCEDPSKTSFTGHDTLARLQAKIVRAKVELLLQNVTLQTSRSSEAKNDKEQTNQLLALVSHPKELFLELYRRYALWFSTHSSEKLHIVTHSIGELLQLPQTKLRLELAHEWLVKDAIHVGKTTSSQDAKEDLFELLEDEQLHRADEDFVKRILYLVNASVKAGDSFGDKIFSYLVEFAKDSRPRAGVTFRAKMRALRVILRVGQLYQAAVERYVTTTHGIENSNFFFKELLDYTKHCTHMVTFEEHRVPYDMDFVLKSNKEILARSFLRRFPPNQPWVLRCVSKLMLDFGVEASDMWEEVLVSMMQLGMVRSLSTMMGPLSRKSFARSLECGRQVWEGVLNSTMTQLKHKRDEHLLGVAAQQGRYDASASVEETMEATLCFAGIPISNVRSALERMVTLLETCPFLDQMDIPAFVIHLRDLTALAEEECNGADIVKLLDLHGFAVKCALIIPKPVARFEALVRIIQAGAYGSVLHELLDISCFLDDERSEKAMTDDIEVADNFRLIQESFKEAAKREDYSAILGTPFEPGFVEYLAATADIDYLLSLMLEEKRMEAALNAVKLYYEYHPLQGTKSDDVYTLETSNDKRWKLIDEYLASSNSAHLERYRTS